MKSRLVQQLPIGSLLVIRPAAGGGWQRSWPSAEGRFTVAGSPLAVFSLCWTRPEHHRRDNVRLRHVWKIFQMDTS